MPIYFMSDDSKQSAMFHGIKVKKLLIMLLNSSKMNAVLFVKILKKMEM